MNDERHVDNTIKNLGLRIVALQALIQRIRRRRILNQFDKLHCSPTGTLSTNTQTSPIPSNNGGKRLRHGAPPAAKKQLHWHQVGPKARKKKLPREPRPDAIIIQPQGEHSYSDILRLVIRRQDEKLKENTFSRAGVGSIVDLTFVSSSLLNVAIWRISNSYTASDNLQILYTIGQQTVANEPAAPRWKRYRVDRPNLERFSDLIYSFNPEGTAKFMANGVLDHRESTCNATMTQRKHYRRHHQQVYWFNDNIADLRRELEVALGSEISVNNLGPIMLQSPENWDAIRVFAASVLVVLRATERERRAQTVYSTLLPLRSNAPAAVP
ncbi:hypothetical protein ACLKA6_001117 [Drosophila palustris]